LQVKLMQAKLRLPILSALLGALLSLAACGNDNGGDPPDAGGGTDGGAGTDAGVNCTIDPTFSSLYMNIFGKTTCVAGGCHDDGAANGIAGNLRMTTKDVAYMELLNESVFDTSSGLANRVKPNDSTMSLMYRKITEDDPPGNGSPMPLGCT